MKKDFILIFPVQIIKFRSNFGQKKNKKKISIYQDLKKKYVSQSPGVALQHRLFVCQSTQTLIPPFFACGV